MNAFQVAVRDSSGLSPGMMQKLTYRLTHMYYSRLWRSAMSGCMPTCSPSIVLGNCVPQTKLGSRCLVDI